jgi:hypothetical protein
MSGIPANRSCAVHPPDGNGEKEISFGGSAVLYDITKSATASKPPQYEPAGIGKVRQKPGRNPLLPQLLIRIRREGGLLRRLRLPPAQGAKNLNDRRGRIQKRYTDTDTSKGGQTMDRRQWVFDAIDRKPVKGIPGSFWFHFNGECQQGQAANDAYGAFVRESDVDLFQDHGRDDLPFPSKPHWIGRVPPHRAQDPLLIKQLDLIRLLTEAFVDEYYIPHSAFGPLRTLRRVRAMP